MAIVFDPCEPIRLVVAPEVGPDARAAIADAAALWGAVAAVDIAAIAPEEGDGIALRVEEAAPAFRGIYLDDEGAIVLNAELSDPAVRAIVVAHELGHAFGLWHREDGAPSVMRAGNADVAPTVADAAALVDRWGACAVAEGDQPAAPSRR